MWNANNNWWEKNKEELINMQNIFRENSEGNTIIKNEENMMIIAKMRFNYSNSINRFNGVDRIKLNFLNHTSHELTDREIMLYFQEMSIAYARYGTSMRSRRVIKALLNEANDEEDVHILKSLKLEKISIIKRMFGKKSYNHCVVEVRKTADKNSWDVITENKNHDENAIDNSNDFLKGNVWRNRMVSVAGSYARANPLPSH